MSHAISHIGNLVGELTKTVYVLTWAGLWRSYPRCRLNNQYPKAYYRRGSANMALGKFKVAVKDFRKVSAVGRPV